MKSEAPDGWRELTLGVCVESQKGVTYRGIDLSGDDGLVSITAIQPGGGFNVDGVRPFSGKYHDRHVLEPLDIIVALTDLTQDGRMLGSPARICKAPAFESLIAAHHVARLRVTDDERLSDRYLFYLLMAPTFRHHVASWATGTTVRQFKTKVIDDFALLAPPLAEQRRIASVLGALDDKIESSRRVVGLADDVAASLYDALMSGALAHHMEWDSVRPRHGTVGDICTLRYGKSLPARARRPGNVAVVGSSGIVGAHDTALVAGPCVVVGRKGTAGSVAWIGHDAYPIDTTYIAEPRREVGLLYLYFALRSADLKQATGDSAVPGLNRDQASARPISVPNARDRNAFEDLASPMFAAKEQAFAEERSLSAIRDTLLPKLISGEVRVPDSEDPEDALGTVVEEAGAA